MSIRYSVLPSSNKAPNYGALYLAVMIARLVGLHIAAGMQGEGNGR
jgi:hypothetical protein